MTDDRAIGALLRDAHTIAIVGLSPREDRPSHTVARYLQEVGYRIVPIRPDGGTILGEPVYPDLSSAARDAGRLDVVDVFRRPEAIASLGDQLLAVRPRLVWLQVGVRDERTAERLTAAGIPVVMDRCLMTEHPRLTSDR